MKSRFIVVLILVLSIVFLLGLASFGHAAEVTSYRQAPDNSVISATKTISVYLPLVNYSGPILYFDDFSDPDSGWPIDDSGNVKRSYQDGEYEILIRPVKYWGGAAKFLGEIGSHSIDAEMRIPNGSDGFYGLIFDFKNWSHLSILAVSPNLQMVGLLRYDNTWSELVPFATSSAIKTGSATNHLRVDRTGNRITAYVNDQLLTSLARSNNFNPSSPVGLFGQSHNSAPVALRFDNFTVSPLLTTSGSSLADHIEYPTVQSAQGPGFSVNVSLTQSQEILE